jgi:hypothetical protein
MTTSKTIFWSMKRDKQTNMLLISKYLKSWLRFLFLSFPDLIGESRERNWIIRSSRIMTIIGAEFGMQSEGFTFEI